MSDRKLTLIRSILNNGTYMPDSRIYQRLEASLSRLPTQDLADLEVLIDLKVKNQKSKYHTD